MKTIVEEKRVSFKTLEQKIFSYVCELGREITTAMLEAYDKELAEGRDKKNYRDKGIRTTTIKTVYGEVSYGRHVYQTKLEDGKKAYVYLLDEAMQMEKIGLISTNLAEKLAMTVTEAPYRVTAETISSTCGQSISAGGVWNVMQRLGERISKEEEHAVKQMHADQSEGKKDGSAGKSELYVDHAEDEEPKDALVSKWSQQSSKDPLSKRKQGIDRDDRAIYGWPRDHDADAGDCGNVKRR